MSNRSFLGDGSLPTAASNYLGDLKTKAGEAGAKLKNTFDGIGNFKKLAFDAGTFKKNAAQLAGDRAVVAAEDPTKRVMDAIDDDIRAMSPDPFYATEADRDLANQQALAASQENNLSAGVVNQAKQQTAADKDHIVKLIEPGVTQVEFQVMPEVVESRTVEYEAIAPPQFPSAFQKYKGTSSTQWTINATFTCRTTDEATRNLEYLNILRGWTVPFFGTKTLEQFPQKLGAPPPVLTFSGWRAQMVGPVQVVITSLNWNFPQDVDYIPAKEFKPVAGNPRNFAFTGRLIPFPTVIKIAIQLVESFSTEQMNGFSVADFRAGQFADAFKPMPRANKQIPVEQPIAEAQTVQQGAYRGQRSDYDPARRVYAGLGQSVSGGRGVINPPEIAVNNVVSEVKSVGQMIPKQPLVQAIKSGGGGDFGGGGASGDF